MNSVRRRKKAKRSAPPAERLIFHYTDKTGFDAIRAQPAWLFRASQPPGERPFGAYFTPLNENSPQLARWLRIPRSKTAYFFCFEDAGDLTPLRGRRGMYIFYSPIDYNVGKERQVRHGPRPLDAEQAQ